MTAKEELEGSHKWLLLWSIKFISYYENSYSDFSSITGDFESEAMEKLLDEKIGKWKPLESGNLPEFPSSPIPDRINHEGQLYLVDFPGSTQVKLDYHFSP